MDDKELDDFFRKQSEHPDIPYREEDWEKLRKKLDASPKNNGAKPGDKGWYIGLLILAMISGIGWGWKYWEEKQPDAVANIQSIVASSGDGKLTEGPLGITDKEDLKSMDGPVRNGLRPLKYPQGIAQTESTPSLKEETAMMQHEVSAFSKSMSGPLPDQRSVIKAIGSRQPVEPPLPDFPNAGYEKAQLAGLPDKNGSIRQVPESAVKERKNIGRRFHTTLTLAPDVSALKIKDIQGLGNSIGLNLEYFFHPKISINAGALYSFKTYQAGEGYSTGYVPSPSHVNGNCWVLDLPVNLRYYAVGQQLSKWYLTAGLSSYLMLKEKYDLEYKSYNYGGNAYGNSLEVQNKNKHYLNIINLGIGYERVLTDRLSLQVEPYLKLPLQGIGEGDISLKSAGAFVGLKYGW